MSNNWKLSMILLSVVIGISSAYVFVAAKQHAARQAAAMTLIRDMDKIDQNLWQASREFGFALTQFLKSADAAAPDAGDSGVVRQSHRTLVDSVNQSIAVVSRLPVPESEHGAAFIAAQRKFLLVQRRIIREDFGQLLVSLEDASIPLAQRCAPIQGIVNAAYTETDREFGSVHAAREKFANEFAIHLTARQ